MRDFCRLPLILALMASPAFAQQDAMVRVLACKGPDARMEVFLPHAIANGQGSIQKKLRDNVIGQYALDLTEAGKGKIVEPVRIRLSQDGKGVVVDQYTRRLPPTIVPLTGGTVNFDNRFGTRAKCEPFNRE